MAQLVGTGGIGFLVGEKLETNVANFYMAHDSVLQGGIMGFNVMGCEGRKELD